MNPMKPKLLECSIQFCRKIKSKTHYLRYTLYYEVMKVCWVGARREYQEGSPVSEIHSTESWGSNGVASVGLFSPTNRGTDAQDLFKINNCTQQKK